MKIKPQVNKSSSVMAKLLAAHKTSFVSLKKGEMVSGAIKKMTSGEILVDVGAKSAALVLEKDKGILHTLLKTFKEGDKVEVLVLSPESEMGQPIVSLRRYLGNMSWDKLEKIKESGESMNVSIEEVAKSGFVVATSLGVSGFLPQSYVLYSAAQGMGVGDKIKVTILELNRKEGKVIFSQKPVFSDEEFDKLTAKFKGDTKVKVKILSVTNFGLFVEILDGGAGLEGFIHISEISWDKTSDLVNLFSQGQEIEAMIAKVDQEAKRIQLSIKRLSTDPFEEMMEKYPVDKKVSASVVKASDSGVEVVFEDGTKAMMKKEKVPVGEEYKSEKKLTVMVSEYDKRRKRIFVVPVLLKKTIGYR